MNPCVIVYGLLGSGFFITGPFPSHSDAMAWVDTQGDFGGATWELLPLHSPSEDEEGV